MIAGRKGFTLVELAVAMVVGGIVVATAHQALATAVEAHGRAESARAEVARLTGARELLTTWLRATVLPGRGYPFVEARDAAGDSRSVTFRVAHGGALFPGARTIRLWVEAVPGGEAGLMAAVSPRRGESGPADTLLLEPEARRLSLRYWGSVSGADRWVETWETPDALPRVVEIRIAGTPRLHIDPEGTRMADLPPLMRLPLRVPLAMGAW